MADLEGAAIAAATARPERVRLEVTISSTGRVIALDVPADLTEAELVEFLLVDVRRSILADQVEPIARRIILPDG